jgi:site-specific DNA-cytosine methylase
MKILAACEERQAVTTALRKLGHEAYSCDIEPCSGGYPEWHLQQNVIPLLNEKWDMIIGFPPCTYFSLAGASWRWLISGRLIKTIRKLRGRI